MVSDLCSQRGATCNRGGSTYFLDTFSDTEVASGYRWFDEGTPDTYSLSNGYLAIAATVWQDLWGGTPVKRGAPILLRSAPRGDYCAETLVAADPAREPLQPINTQIGLFVFKDVDNWLFFGLTNHDFEIDGTRMKGDGLIVTTTEGGVSRIVAQCPLKQDFAFLRIVKQLDNWKLYWKLQYDDIWILAADVKLVLAGHEVGMGLKTLDLMPPNEVSAGRAYFDFFLIDWSSYVGNRRTLEIHTHNCTWVSRMKQSNKTPFTSVEQALIQVYNGCWYCLNRFDTG